MCHDAPVHLPKPSRCFPGWCCLIILLALGSATVHAERFLYSFSGRVRSIDDPSGALATSNYYRTGDVVSASFIVDVSRPGYQILNDGTEFVMLPVATSSLLWNPFYCRLISGPLMPEPHSATASHPKAARYYLYGANQTFVTRTATLTGGSAASSLTIVPKTAAGWIEDWREGVEVSGFANAATDTGESPAAMIDMRLDSISPAPNLHPPEPVPSVPQAINIPGLIESTNYTYFTLGGRTPHTRVRLNASPSTDGDGDPLYFEWRGLVRRVPPIVIGILAHGEAPVINLIPGTHGITLRASDGSLEGVQEFFITVYTPTQATDLMRNAVRALPGSSRAKTTALALLQNATSSFQRADWRRGLQFLQAFEQFMSRSAYTIPSSKRTSLTKLSQAIRRAVAQPQ